MVVGQRAGPASYLRLQTLQLLLQAAAALLVLLLLLQQRALLLLQLPHAAVGAELLPRLLPQQLLRNHGNHRKR